MARLTWQRRRPIQPPPAMCGALDRWFPIDDHPGLAWLVQKLFAFCLWSIFFVLCSLVLKYLEATGVLEAIGGFAFWVVAYITNLPAIFWVVAFCARIWIWILA